MILETLSIQNFKSLQGNISLGPFSKGLNIIYGPNGIGKSNVLSALTEGLLSNHSSKAEKIKAFQAWGKSLSPKITIEFNNFENKYKLEKQFLENAYSKLKIWHQEKWEDIAEASEAEKQLRELWQQDPENKPRGVAEIANWGWQRLLWSPQNNIDNIGLDNKDLDSFFKIIGAATISPTEIKFKELLINRYETFFTKTGKIKRKDGYSELESLKENILKLEDNLDMIEKKYSSSEESRLKAKKAEENLNLIEIKLKEISYFLEKNLKLEEEYRKTEKYILEAKLKLEKLEKEISNFKHLNENLKKEEETKLKIANENMQLEEKISKQQEEFCQTEISISNIEFSKIKKEKEEKENMLNKINLEKENIKNLIAEGKALKAPTSEDLDNLRNLFYLYKKNKETLKASELVVSLKWPNIKIKALKGKITKKTDGTIEIRGLGEIEALVENLGPLKASAKNSKADELKFNLKKSHEELILFWKKWNFKKFKVLEEKMQKRLNLVQLHKEANNKLKTLLNEKTIEFYEKGIKTLEEEQLKIKEFLKSLNLEINLETANLSENNLEQLKNSYHQTKNNIKNYKDKVKENTQVIEKSEKLILNFKNLIGPPLEAQNKFKNNLLNYDVYKVKIEELTKKLVAPDKKLTKIKNEWDNLVEKEKIEKENLNSLVAEITYLNKESLFTKKENFKNELSFLNKKYKLQEIEQNAVKLNYDIYFEKRNYLDKNKAIFLTEKAEEIYKTLTKNKFTDLNFSKQLSEITLKPNTLPNGVIKPEIKPEDLSLGEKDLLFLTIRLAAAELLSQNQSRLLLLDDVISNFDDSKLKALIEKLLILSEKTQIILFTCHYSRIKNLKAAKYFNLQEIKENS